MNFKLGDLVKRTARSKDVQAGIITGFLDKKCWRTDKMGAVIDWKLIEPELHATVLFGDRYIDIPVTDLELFVESR
jgi:hypothetical protein